MAALLMLAAAACSQSAAPPVAVKPQPRMLQPRPLPNTAPGSYIVKAPADGDKSIRRLFSEYGVTLVRPLGNEQFEVRLSQDPGLEALQRLAAGSRGAVTAVQPNYIYTFH